LKTALIVAVGGASLATIPAASAMRSGWPTVATTTVTGRSDTSNIYLPGRQRYRAIKLCVAKSPLKMRDIRIHYRNGARQDVDVRQRIAPGNCTRRIDLRGRDRDRDITRIRVRHDRLLLGQRAPQIRVKAH
ncbi:MAG: hypothetical protein ACREBM_03200, partial [Sphingomicrobium sp.]